MAKRDYYEVLGVEKSASPDQIKQLTENKQSNIILIKIKATKELRKNLKKLLKRITFYQTQRENRITIISDTQLLKMAEVVEEVLETLTFQAPFQIFLRIFLEKDLVEVEEDLEDLITEDLI